MKKKYFGTFSNRQNKLINVDITPSDGLYDEEVEVKFAYGDAVVIGQDDDEVFKAIKGKSCTIRLFTEDIYWDLYTPSAVGYYVRVYDNDMDYFNGFLTPCIYTQDYAYKATIELEAVDVLTVLDSFDYWVDGDMDILTIQQIMSKMFTKIPNFNAYHLENKTSFNFNNYYLQEANFFDDDGTPMKCKEILEQLFTYLGFTATMYNGKIQIIDYSTSTKKAEVITTTKYGEGTPTIALDDVYNKISIGCDLYEVSDRIDDIFDDGGKTTINEIKKASGGERIYEDGYVTRMFFGSHIAALVKPYAWVDEATADGKQYIQSKWESLPRRLSDHHLTTDTLEQRINNDNNKYKSKITDGHYVFSPHYSTAYPIRVYTYEKQDGYENNTTINWEDMIFFPVLDYDTMIAKTYTDNLIAATYKNTEKIAYSIKGGKGYLVLNAKLFAQIYFNIPFEYDNGAYCQQWNTQTQKAEWVLTPFPIDKGNAANVNMKYAERGKNDPKFNQGWHCMRVQIRIGDKYWNGSEWSKGAYHFYLNFHTEDVGGKEDTNEALNYLRWLVVAQNPQVKKLEVGEEGYAIPITEDDMVNGDLEVTLWCPKIEDENDIPSFFLKDLSLKYIYKNNSNWADDEVSQDDIVYENVISEDNAIEMNEIDLKINSWYQDKPISKSYMLDNNKRPVDKINNKIQEVRLLEKYYDHYSTPKKKFELNYKVVDVDPLTEYYHLQTDTKYIVNGYETNLSSGETELKLIEL